jgi:type III secretion protein V
MVSKKQDKPAPVDVVTQFTDLMKVDQVGTALQDVTTTDTYEAIELRLPHDLEPTTANQLQNICRIARNRQIEHLGIVLPLVEVKKHQEPFAELYIFGVPALTIDTAERRMSVVDSEENIKAVQGFEYVEERDRVTGRIHYLCEPRFKPVLDQHQIKYNTYENRLLEQIETILVTKIGQLFNLHEYQKHLNALGDRFSEQIKELDRVMPVAKVVGVLQKLMIEKVSIKNLRTIFNALIEWGQRERDLDVITEQVRRALFEQICHQHSQSKKLRVFILGVELEQLIRESIRSQGARVYVDIDSSSLNEIVDIVVAQYKAHLRDEIPPAIVCSMDCRMFFRQIIEHAVFCVPVLSHQEISANLEIQVLGHINIDELHPLDR